MISVEDGAARYEEKRREERGTTRGVRCAVCGMCGMCGVVLRVLIQVLLSFFLFSVTPLGTACAAGTTTNIGLYLPSFLL